MSDDYALDYLGLLNTPEIDPDNRPSTSAAVPPVRQAAIDDDDSFGPMTVLPTTRDDSVATNDTVAAVVESVPLIKHFLDVSMYDGNSFIDSISTVSNILERVELPPSDSSDSGDPIGAMPPHGRHVAFSLYEASGHKGVPSQREPLDGGLDFSRWIRRTQERVHEAVLAEFHVKHPVRPALVRDIIRASPGLEMELDPTRADPNEGIDWSAPSATTPHEIHVSRLKNLTFSEIFVGIATYASGAAKYLCVLLNEIESRDFDWVAGTRIGPGTSRSSRGCVSQIYRSKTAFLTSFVQDRWHFVSELNNMFVTIAMASLVFDVNFASMSEANLRSILVLDEASGSGNDAGWLGVFLPLSSSILMPSTNLYRSAPIVSNLVRPMLLFESWIRAIDTRSTIELVSLPTAVERIVSTANAGMSSLLTASDATIIFNPTRRGGVCFELERELRIGQGPLPVDIKMSEKIALIPTTDNFIAVPKPEEEDKPGKASKKPVAPPGASRFKDKAPVATSPKRDSSAPSRLPVRERRHTTNTRVRDTASIRSRGRASGRGRRGVDMRGDRASVSQRSAK